MTTNDNCHYCGEAGILGMIDYGGGRGFAGQLITLKFAEGDTPWIICADEEACRERQRLKAE